MKLHLIEILFFVFYPRTFCMFIFFFLSIVYLHILFVTYKYNLNFSLCVCDVTLLIKSFDDENIFTYIIWEEFISMGIHPLLALGAMRANIVKM